MREDPTWPPPIRYPLPTLVVAAGLALVWWVGHPWIERTVSAMSAPFVRLAKGPAYPASPRPRVRSGPIVRRVLLLRDDVPLRPKPGSPTSETLRRRGFYDLFDVWPDSGEPTDLRIGNDKLTGWIASAEGLAWDTRLVLIVGDRRKLELREGPDGAAGAGPSRSVRACPARSSTGRPAGSATGPLVGRSALVGGRPQGLAGRRVGPDRQLGVLVAERRRAGGPAEGDPVGRGDSGEARPGPPPGDPRPPPLGGRADGRGPRKGRPGGPPRLRLRPARNPADGRGPLR